MTLLTEWSATISTDCECRVLDDQDNEVTPDYCHGCQEWMLEDTLALLEEWLERNQWPDAVIINGVAMTWQRLSGYALIRATGDKIARETLDKLTLNGDFTLELKLTGRACHAVRRSHDEPTGASFELQAFAPCDGWSECQAVNGIGDHEGVNLCAACYEIELANN